MESMHGAFLLFKALKAILHSAYVAGLVLMLRSSGSGGVRRVDLAGGNHDITQVVNPFTACSPSAEIVLP